MTEQAPQQNYELDKRPLGRFLLSEAAVPNRERIWHRGAYGYARNFAIQFSDQLRPSGSTFIARAEIDDDGQVSISSNAPSFDKAVWLEFEQEKQSGYTWRLNAGGDEYYMDITEHTFTVTKYETNSQGSVLRRYEVTDQDNVEALQTLVEIIVAESALEVKVKKHREAMIVDLERYNTYSDESGLTLRQHKERSALLKSAHEPFFHAGSIGPRHKRPLY